MPSIKALTLSLIKSIRARRYAPENIINEQQGFFPTHLSDWANKQHLEYIAPIESPIQKPQFSLYSLTNFSILQEKNGRPEPKKL